jgi:signal transduction histidine kinase/CheY-like chemotaxis protein
MALEVRLQESGIDVAGARANGQYIELDAAEILSQVTTGGSLDPDRFATVIEKVIARATGKGRVRIFGELVALLVQEGKCDEAVHLEALWNQLQETTDFVLFCAYPMSGFDEEAIGEALGDICWSHSHVIPAESYDLLASPDERARMLVQLQQKARLLETEIAKREQLLLREHRARTEAESANRMKDEFLATVSHELRTPLTIILGWAQILRKGGRDEATVARGLEMIERSARLQVRLVEDLLDVSRVVSGKLRLDIEPVDVASVINAAIDAVQLAADAKGIELTVKLDPSARHVSGDSNRLQQVFWNLLSNAVKFTPPAGRVEVQLAWGDSTDVEVRITDTGQGITPDFIPFVFDYFRQADSTPTRRHGGLGLGLAIVRHLVELHGGTVQAHSEGEGRGATFTVRLPQAAVQTRPVSHGSDTRGLTPTHEGMAQRTLTLLDGVTVLLADDDTDLLQFLMMALTEEGADVQLATSVPEAMELLTRYRPDVLISDLAMPGGDGYSLIRTVRAEEKQAGRALLAIALTAYARLEDRVQALSAGFDMFLTKPVEAGELVTVIANLIQRQ